MKYHSGADSEGVDFCARTLRLTLRSKKNTNEKFTSEKSSSLPMLQPKCKLSVVKKLRLTLHRLTKDSFQHEQAIKSAFKVYKES